MGMSLTKEQTMNLKTLALAAAAGTALLSAPGAFANPHDYDRPSQWARDHDYRAHHDYRDYRWNERRHYYHPRYVAQPVVLQPVPYYAQPAYSPAPREIYGTFPIGKTDVRVGVQF
jgi:hypothetical protein